MFEKIVSLMKNRKLITSQDDEIIFRYGFELLINAVISVSVLFILGTLLGYWKETIIFYLTYLFLKKNTGGSVIATVISIIDIYKTKRN